MRIVNLRDVHTYRRRQKRQKQVRRGFVVVMVVVLLTSYVAFALQRPLPVAALVTTTNGPVVTARQVEMSWPSYGQSGFATKEHGVLAVSANETKPMPIASITKIMTALTVLETKPLKPGESGPMLPSRPEDSALFNSYLARNGVVVPVNGEQPLNQYQAMQAMLLPSANNVADMLAVWAYGSLDAYVVAANKQAKKLGMNNSNFDDASGFSEKTTSTPHDLLLLGIAALRNPIVEQIIGQQTAEVPVAGMLRNTNILLGRSGIVGIKTGNTDQAGGCFLAAANHDFGNGHKITALAVVLGAPQPITAIKDSLTILESGYSNFADTPVALAGQVVGHYKTHWGATSEIVVKTDSSLFLWNGEAVKPELRINQAIQNDAAGSVVGDAVIEHAGKRTSLPLYLKSSLPPPPLYWRLTHVF